MDNHGTPPAMYQILFLPPRCPRSRACLACLAVRTFSSVCCRGKTELDVYSVLHSVMPVIADFDLCRRRQLPLHNLDVFSHVVLLFGGRIDCNFIACVHVHERRDSKCCRCSSARRLEDLHTVTMQPLPIEFLMKLSLNPHLHVRFRER